jgi:abortive infection bacteriophage resistance protein
VSNYRKPHLSYQEQLDLIRSRGATCADDRRGVELLQAVGYYSLTGYLHPYRVPGPSGERRSDRFRDGTRLEDVSRLIDFDRKLRTCLLEGVLLVEVAIRARIAYVLGRRDPFGHVTRPSLERKACSRKRRRGSKTQTAFDWWLEEYARLEERASREPFVAHNLERYGRPLAIWIACEFLDFGAVSNLYQLLLYSDRQEIAESTGLSKEKILRSWITSLNHVRNVCAHNQRLWNRVLTVKPSIPESAPPALQHLVSLGNTKPYCAIAITAYLVGHLNPNAGWGAAVASVINSFPDIPHRSLAEVGVPDGWAAEPIWK